MGGWPLGACRVHSQRRPPIALQVGVRVMPLEERELKARQRLGLGSYLSGQAPPRQMSAAPAEPLEARKGVLQRLWS